MPDHRLADRLQGPLAGRLTFRPAEADDEPFLRQVFDSTRESIIEFLDWDARRESAFLAMQYLAQSSHYRRAFAGSGYDVIELDRRPVGRIFVHRGPEEVRVVDVGLLPQHRGRGIGGAVLLAVMAEAAEAGRPVRLQTDPSNRALRLYERLGFVRVATTGIHVDLEWIPGPGAGPSDGTIEPPCAEILAKDSPDPARPQILVGRSRDGPAIATATALSLSRAPGGAILECRSSSFPRNVPTRKNAMTRLLCHSVGLVLLALAVGCAEEKPAKPKIEARSTIGKTTQEVRNLKPELAKGGKTTDGKIHATGYLDTLADSYRTEVAKIAKMRVQNDMSIYEAINGEKPKTYEEFMEQIIKKGKAEGIQLPMLPYYQEYGYDPDKKELVVIEYPAKKKAMEEQSAGEFNRK